MIVKDYTGISVVGREYVLKNEPYFLEINKLDMGNGRSAYGCFAQYWITAEFGPRRSIRTEVYTTREEAISEGWELYLSIEPTLGNTHSYIARAACGCIRAAVIEDWPGVLENVREWRIEGALIERVTHDYVRQNMRPCPHVAVQASLFEVTQ
jgi:hypothetical protein